MKSAMKPMCISLVVLLAWFVGQASGYSNGKVTVACGNMMPQHSHLPSPNPPPFSITVERSTIRPGESITVTLQASSSLAQFKGFLLETRDTVGPGVNPTASWGSFSLLQPNISQLLHCGGKQGSGVSHTSGSRKLQVQALWECPKDSPQRVQFFATVVQKYKVFWVQIPGPVLTIIGTTGVSTTPGVITPTTAPALSTALSSEGCGHTKSCLREPVGCSPQADQGCVFLSFSADASGDSVLFELSGPAEGYVAFALSLDKWMGKDDVYLCIKDEDRVNIHAAYVLGRTHPELAQEEVLRDKASAVSNGVLRCRFRRDVLVPQMEERFSLNQSYFLFLAHGRAQDGSFLRHDRQPLISSDRALITGPPVDLSGSRSPLIIKIHAVMMLVALMWFVSTGVLFARHYKNMWPTVLPRGERLWFQIFTEKYPDFLKGAARFQQIFTRILCFHGSKSCSCSCEIMCPLVAKLGMLDDSEQASGNSRLSGEQNGEKTQTSC